MWLVVSKLLAFLLAPLSLALILFLIGFTSVILGSKKLSVFFTVLGVVILVVCSTPMIAAQMVGSLQNQYRPTPVENSPTAKMIVVLGGALGMPFKPRIEIELTDSSDRVLHAFRLFKAGKSDTIFLSAGNISYEGIEQAEAFYISRLLREWGTPANAIVLGKSSRTTRENAVETHVYLDDNQAVNEPVLLVTSAIHMPRAVKTFQKLGINVIPSSTDIIAAGPLVPGFLNWLPSLGALNAFTHAWHEYLGLWVYRLRGWV